MFEEDYGVMVCVCLLCTRVLTEKFKRHSGEIRVVLQS
jgi:hypothetical protein